MPVLFGAGVVDVLSSNGLWIIPLIIVLLGVLVGYFISLVVTRHKEDNAYLSGQIVSCLLLFVFATAEGYGDWKYRKYESNVEENHDVMQYQVNDDEPYVRTAFSKLEASFSNPNEFNLQSFHVRKQDTVINSVRDTLYTIYFTYFLNTNDKQERLSRFNVFQNKADLSYIHLLADTTKEYQDLMKTFREENKEHIEDGERMMRQMEEKGERAVIDSLTKLVK